MLWVTNILDASSKKRMMDVNQTDCFILSKVDVICDYYYQISDFYNGLKLMFCIRLFQTDLLYIWIVSNKSIILNV